MMKNWIQMFVIMCLICSCKKEVIKTGQTLRKGPLIVEFVDFSDSRCPKGVECFWEGQGRGDFIGRAMGKKENYQSTKKAHLTINK